MLNTELKTDVLELAAIAKECPEGLKDKCFELLLSHYLKQLEAGAKRGHKTGEDAVVPAPKSTATDSSTVVAATPSDQDLEPKDLHVKARKFLEKYEKTIDDLNQILFKEGEELRPLFEDLKTTKTSESQVRIALLQALISGIKSGEFQFDGEEVRKECQARKCYDANNFSANFKNNGSLFDGFDKYEKQYPIVKLSEAGRKALAQVIGDLR
jgi:hypothetical protein